ncbi:OLC1v1035791C1 [Oldenlandia corymbosa var. corymbosa]|uniref:tRNA pseudouridine synthase n=1 Tax=Oldenlandia corymbosa var. corymbosa TaxID=529605 RepID=A0AAV1CV91_OLDCO|nr:OLC1v1035791C1 [Oldenlandia corymbosa var. corymbosa]
MDAQLEKSNKANYDHYEHTDSCRFLRWTAKECYQYMYSRPWQKVNDFYSEMVQGRVSLSNLFKKEALATCEDSEYKEDHADVVQSKDRSGRWARVTFKILLSYHGSSFDGWQKQPGLNTVQGIVERSLGKFVDEKKSQLLKEKNLPLEGCAVVAGRTDKGVTAFQQVCSFYTWREDVKPQEIEEAINNAALGKMKVISVAKVSREFHPNFSAKWRRYLYIFPFNDGEGEHGSHVEKDSNEYRKVCADWIHNNYTCVKDNGHNDDNEEMDAGNKPTMFEVSKVDRLLRQLEGKLLSYKMFARDTKASRNTGPPTECFVFHARAMVSALPFAQDGTSTRVMCIELVANRFLRKMVRVLVATAVREAAAGAEDDALLKLMDSSCRRATAPPSPPDGLSLVDVGYTDFVQKNCFIS